MANNPKKLKQLESIIDASIRVFSARGYRQTQMSHIANEMGIAPGTMYLYFESKEVLFNFLLKRIFTNSPDLETVELPIRATSDDFGIHSAKNAFASSGAIIVHAIGKKNVRDARGEFETIIRSLFTTLASYRQGITISLQSSLSWPEHAIFYTGVVKDFLVTLTTYLNQRIKSGQMRKVPNVDASARFILETVAWFAVHRHRALYQTDIDEQEAEEVVVDALLNVFFPEPGNVKNPR